MKKMVAIVAAIAMAGVAFGAEEAGGLAKEPATGMHVTVSGTLAITAVPVSSSNTLGIASATVTSADGTEYSIVVSSLKQTHDQLMALSGQTVTMKGEVKKGDDGKLTIKVDGDIAQHIEKPKHNKDAAGEKPWKANKQGKQGHGKGGHHGGMN